LARRETAARAAASEQRLAELAAGCLEVFVDCLPGLLGELELDGVTRLLLSHGRTIDGVTARSDILNHHADKVAAAQFAIDREIEEGEITLAILDLEPRSDGPDMLRPEWRLSADELSFVPGLPLVRREQRDQ